MVNVTYPPSQPVFCDTTQASVFLSSGRRQSDSSNTDFTAESAGVAVAIH